MLKNTLLIAIITAISFSVFSQTANTLLDTNFLFCSQITSFNHSLTNFPTPTPRDFNKVLVLSDDKIMVSGPYKATLNGEFHEYLLRLNADGSLDSSFKYFVGDNRIITKVIELPNGQYLVAGDKRIHRINNDGSEDASFNSLEFDIAGTSTGHSHIKDVALMQNGNILVGGEFVIFNGDSVFHLVELNADGTLNNVSNNIFSTPSFGGSVLSVMPLSDSRYIIITNSNGVLIFKPNGNLDTTAYLNLDLHFSTFKMAQQADGKFIFARDVGGDFTALGNATIARFNSDFTFDSTFTPVRIPRSGNNRVIKSIKLTPSGKLMVVGSFTEVNGNPYRRIVRINPDGSIDNTFDPGPDAFIGGGTNYDLDFQSDGKIIMTHSHTNHNNIFLTNNNILCFIIRLNGDAAGGGNPNNPPLAPSNLTATSTNSIELNWQDNSDNEEGFIIETASSAAGPWTIIDTVGANTTTYLHTGLTVGVEYFYQLRAYNDFGVSPNSNIANAVNLSTSTEENWAEKLSLFPNPAKHNIHIRNFPANADLRVVNALGIILIDNQFSTDFVEINTNEWASGIYYFQIIKDGKAQTRKVAVLK